MCLFPSHKAAREDATSCVIENGMEKVWVPTTLNQVSWTAKNKSVNLTTSQSPICRITSIKVERERWLGFGPFGWQPYPTRKQWQHFPRLNGSDHSLSMSGSDQSQCVPQKKRSILRAGRDWFHWPLFCGIRNPSNTSYILIGNGNSRTLNCNASFQLTISMISPVHTVVVLILVFPRMLP